MRSLWHLSHDIARMVDNMGNGGDGDACLCGDFFDGHKTPPFWYGFSPAVPARLDLNLPQFCVSVFLIIAQK